MNEFDVIIIGSGISGGWAAKEFCEKGLKTLVLERGRDVKHLKDYPTATMNPWEIKYRGKLPLKIKEKNPLISKAAGYGEDTMHFFINDEDQPYEQKSPFDWIRGFQVGGKSLIWGRACQRWSNNEFSSPAKNGYGIEWPINYEDVSPWYSHVEKFIGVCGNKDNIEAMPDGEFLPPFDLNCVEDFMVKELKKYYPDRHLVQGRWAHLTKPEQIHFDQGRGSCQARNLCMRGCPFGGYFSSNSCTLPWAEKTGNLTIRPHSVVHSIIYDEIKKRANGVHVIDAVTKEHIVFNAKIIFVNASALNSNLILLNSKSERFPNGLGNDNNLLGKFICFHNYRGLTVAKMPGFQDKYYYGRNPSELILANYRNLKKQETDFKGGYTIFSGAHRDRVDAVPQNESQIGKDFKNKLREAGNWNIYMYMQGETIPKAENMVYLSDKKDSYGLPILVIDVKYDENDEKMTKDFLKESQEMIKKMGCVDIKSYDSKQSPGLDIHEMGGVRMGKDPKNSLLNKWNQMHHCQNVFVTDGACMTSTGNQSPSILYMALTARASNYAIEKFKNKEFN